MAALQTLKQIPSPFSLEERSEFMGYYILFHIRNEPPPENPRGGKSALLRFTRAFREEVKKASPAFAKRSELKVSEEGVALFAKFSDQMLSSDMALSGFEEIGKSEKWRRSVVYLVSSLLEFHFGEGAVMGMEERRGGLGDKDIIQCDDLLADEERKKASLNGSSTALNPQAAPFVSSFGLQNMQNGATVNGDTSIANSFTQTQAVAPAFGPFSGGVFSSTSSAFNTTSKPGQPNAFGIITPRSTTPQPPPPLEHPHPATSFPFVSSAVTSEPVPIPTTQQTTAASGTTSTANAFGAGAGNTVFGFGKGSAFGGSFSTTVSAATTPPKQNVFTESSETQRQRQQAQSPQQSIAQTYKQHPFTGPAVPMSLTPPITVSNTPSMLPFSFSNPTMPSHLGSTVPSFQQTLPSNKGMFAAQDEKGITFSTPERQQSASGQPSALGLGNFIPTNEGPRPTFNHVPPAKPSTAKPFRNQGIPKPAQQIVQSNLPKTVSQPPPASPLPVSRKGWAADFGQIEFQHLFQCVFAAILADTLAKESYERKVRRQLKSCFDRWIRRATERCEKKLEKFERERRRSVEWKQREAIVNGGTAGMSKLKRARMSSVIISRSVGSHYDNRGRQVKRRLDIGPLKSAAEIGEEVIKVRRIISGYIHFSYAYFNLFSGPNIDRSIGRVEHSWGP